MRDQLAKLDEQTFFGPLKFNAQGQNVTKFMSVVQVQNGKAVGVWPKDSAEAQLQWPGTAKPSAPAETAAKPTKK